MQRKCSLAIHFSRVIKRHHFSQEMPDKKPDYSFEKKWIIVSIPIWKNINPRKIQKNIPKKYPKLKIFWFFFFFLLLSPALEYNLSKFHLNPRSLFMVLSENFQKCPSGLDFSQAPSSRIQICQRAKIIKTGKRFLFTEYHWSSRVNKEKKRRSLPASYFLPEIFLWSIYDRVVICTLFLKRFWSFY